MSKTYIYALLDPEHDFSVRYIGKSTNPHGRYLDHCKNFTNCKTHKERWISILDSKGLKPKLQIVAQVKSEEWQYWEIFYIDAFKKAGHRLTNETVGGEGQHAMTDEVRSKISNKLKGFKHTEETRIKMSNERKESFASGKRKPPGLGKYPSEETRKKMSESHHARVTDEYRKKLSDTAKANMTDERRAEISKNLTGRPVSEETRKKMSESAKNRKRKEL